MKTRSSAGVGQKIDLEFDLNTLRITDAGVESDVPTAGEVMDNIKPCVTSSNNNLQQSPKVDADIKSAKLQSLLNSIKT
jgi:hypothetical protein